MRRADIDTGSQEAGQSTKRRVPRRNDRVECRPQWGDLQQQLQVRMAVLHRPGPAGPGFLGSNGEAQDRR